MPFLGGEVVVVALCGAVDSIQGLVQARQMLYNRPKSLALRINLYEHKTRHSNEIDLFLVSELEENLNVLFSYLLSSLGKCRSKSLCSD